MAAAQFYDAATRALPGIPEALSAGNFAPLMEWLRVNVHGKGSCYETPELIEKATGQPLDPEIFKRHLRTRYLGESRLG
ncbi:MAG: carboxypeptidase M32, partial [Proteobacteria bacterium]|nr:carboxypeptidase M32 [Pseudomonadota bacterium]